MEMLKTHALTVPETTELIWELDQAGMSLPLDALTPEACADAICAALK